jgi:hypothetical protein
MAAHPAPQVGVDVGSPERQTRRDSLQHGNERRTV